MNRMEAEKEFRRFKDRIRAEEITEEQRTANMSAFFGYIGTVRRAMGDQRRLREYQDPKSLKRLPKGVSDIVLRLSQGHINPFQANQELDKVEQEYAHHLGLQAQH